MIEISGKYTNAKIYHEYVESEVISQVLNICSHPIFKSSNIRIMSDCHVGKGCVIGFTSDLIDNKIIPNIVGVDIGCGMITVKIGSNKLNLQAIDHFIRNNIPHGSAHNKKTTKNQDLQTKGLLERLKIGKMFDYKDVSEQIGTLGGGNHFIEIAKDSKDCLYLVIHSGSRNFGYTIANHYQEMAESYCLEKSKDINYQIIKYGGFYKIQDGDFIKECEDNDFYKIDKSLSFLEGENAKNYLNDVKIAREFSTLNRKAMAERILNFIGLELSDLSWFETIHNYIGEDNIIRKGAVSAYKDEKILIPLNMRDGSILAIGKGNKDWNYSAPHGAGRIMSRSEAKKSLSFEEYKDSMEGIFTTSVKESTLDEAPSAYKNMDEIIKFTQDTIEIVDIIKPIYNFKA